MSWESPRTTKLYLHPPLAQRQVTVWPDLKIVSKAVVPPPGVKPDDYGLRLLIGPEAQPVDWLATRFGVRPDGAPLPTLSASSAPFELALTAFCDWSQQPVTYLQLAVTHRGSAPETFHLGLMARSGLDALLIGMHGDYYASYRPELAHWDMLPNTWSPEANAAAAGCSGSLRDSAPGEHHIRWLAPANSSARWVERHAQNDFAKTYLELCTPVAPGETACFYITLGVGEVPAPTAGRYEGECSQAVGLWRTELAQIAVRPSLPSEELRAMFNSLVCQCLQMLVTTASGEVWPRQGGRYDGVWPVEAMEFLRALDRLGLYRWTELGYSVFRRYQVAEGDDAGRFMGVNSPHWTNETGGVLYGLAYHLRQRNDHEYFLSWREPVLRAIAWIEAQRAKTRDDPEALGYGLFPAGIGHDWQWPGQYWCFTDGITYMGIDAMSRTLLHFYDPEAQRVRALVRDYDQCLRRTLRRLTRGKEEQEEIYLPNVLGVPDQYPPSGPYHGDGPTNLVRAGFIDPKSHLFEQIEAYWRARGWIQRGLTARMTDSLMTQGYFADPWAGHTWYTSFSDLVWFDAWLARGERDKAEETLQAQLRYGMSAEYYMLERYADNDATFCPWQPNASANGRTLAMLFAFYGEERNT